MSEKNTNMINTYRQQLMFLSQQKQQLQLQASVLENTIKELEITKEAKVYKGVGNVFILKDKSEVVKETKENKETVDLRLKTVEKQEADALKKLSELTKESQQEKAKGASPVLKDSSSDGIA
jgi:prefoldin beta subunit